MSNVVTRFAPSPTGFLHVGSARTALYAWLYARQNGGKFILRIEDTDKAREVEGSIPHIIESLTWLGITWDEGPDIGGPSAPYLQSERLGSYRKYAEELIAKGFAYPDPFTEEELEAFRKKAEDEKRPFLFRDHRPETFGTWDGKQPLRFRIPEIKRYEWEDMVRGKLSAGAEALDDFILIKGDGYPTYNFAHIIDDLEMGVTHIMRGEEFISSTPKFLALYDALGIEPPAMATMPAILGPSGTKKLSKRDGAKDLLDYRKDGYVAVAMTNFLALLGWHPGGEEEFFTLDELMKTFDITKIQKAGAHFDEVKLLSINQHWLREMPDEEFIRLGGLEAPDADVLRKAVPLLKERVKTLGEAREVLAGELACLFTMPAIDAKSLAAKEPENAPGASKKHLEEELGRIDAVAPEPTPEEVRAVLAPYADANPKEAGGRGAVLWPLRYALSGQEKSPDPYTLISVLGREEALRRVRAAIAILG